MIKQIDNELYQLIRQWWAHHKWPVMPPDMLPRTGYMAYVNEKPIVAAFLYKMDTSKIGWLEWFVSNPDSTYDERTQGMDELFETSFAKAKEMGIGALFTSCKNESLLKRLQEKGFVITDQEMTNLIKTIT